MTTTCFQFFLSCFLISTLFMQESFALANHPHPSASSVSSSNPPSPSSADTSEYARFGVYSYGESCLFGGSSTSVGATWMGRKVNVTQKEPFIVPANKNHSVDSFRPSGN